MLLGIVIHGGKGFRAGLLTVNCIDGCHIVRSSTIGSSEWQSLAQSTRHRGVRSYCAPHTNQSMVAVRVAPLKTHRGSILKGVAHSLDLRNGYWGRALVQVSDIFVSSHVSTDMRFVALTCWNG